MLEIKKMTAADIKNAAELEKMTFSSPWSEEMLRMMSEQPNGRFFCAFYDGNFAGYVGMLCVFDEGQICNVAVSPEFRRLGIGTALMAEQMKTAKDCGLSFITLEVRAGNTAAQAMYEKQGWKKVGVRKNYYEKPREDGFLYDYTIS